MSKAFGTLVMIAALVASLGIVAAATNSSTMAAYSVNVRYNSTVGNYLATNSGYALYTYTPDKAYSGSSTCAGACIQIWPAYYNSTMYLAPGLNSSSFGVINRTGGAKQLTYLGMPLYTYIYDTKPGQVSGQGVGGVWYAAKVSNYAPASNSSSATKPVAVTNSSSKGNGANTTAVGIAGNVQRSAENSTANQSTTGTTTPAPVYSTGSGGSSTLLYAGIIIVIIIIIIAAYFMMRKR